MRDPSRRRNVHLLHVCTKCRRPGAQAAEGRQLFEQVKQQLAALAEPPPVRLNGVECLSGCNHSCTIAIAAPGKPTYLFGDLSPGPGQAAQIVTLAALYRRSEDGELPGDEWPAALRAVLLARIAPHRAD